MLFWSEQDVPLEKHSYPTFSVTAWLAKLWPRFIFKIRRLSWERLSNPGLSLTAGRINRLLGSFVLATFVVYIYFRDKLFVPLLAQIYENETYFPLQFIDLKIIWLAQRYTIISSLRWVLGTTCRKRLKAWVYTNKIENLRLLLELTLLEICAQNQGNSVSGSLRRAVGCSQASFLGGGIPPHPPRRDRLWRSIITIRLLRNFCQLLEKLWTTLQSEFSIQLYPDTTDPRVRAV